ncbi:MAG TPA: ROK family transcriptional regulator [Actinoplanes sp.]|jgi:predicted NBD/HSP70 family sugar kinase
MDLTTPAPPPARQSGPPAVPARQESLRTLNLAMVFGQIMASRQPVSRTELVASTGLARPTISRIIEELITARLVAESGLAYGGGAGRPRVGLVVSRRGPAGLGLDIRADGLAACVVDLTGAVRHLAHLPTGTAGRSAERVLAEVGRMARSAISAAAAEGLTVVGATLAVPGRVEGGSLVRAAPALGWHDVDAGAILRHATRTFNLPVSVDNEANVAALGELHSGDHDRRSFAYVSGGLAIGIGLVLDGQLLRGARGWSGELGHVTVYPDGRQCPCGATGCLYAYAGVPAILAGEDGGRTDLARDASIAALAESGNAAVLAGLDTAGTALGIALSAMLNLLDVETVLLGGSYSLLFSWLHERVRTEISRRVLTTAWAPVDVRPALLGPDAAAVGAALASTEPVRLDPAAWLTQAAAAAF